MLNAGPPLRPRPVPLHAQRPSPFMFNSRPSQCPLASTLDGQLDWDQAPSPSLGCIGTDDSCNQRDSSSPSTPSGATTVPRVDATSLTFQHDTATSPLLHSPSPLILDHHTNTLFPSL
ncbi:hypothetical protein BDQ17DRAFT_1429733 [Cyathus striatus]|nr:hypothetical protein BDQ17DRAFT_1429733 [Cyathus striatus]